MSLPSVFSNELRKIIAGASACLIALAPFFISPAYAAIPQTISYQSRLLNSSGVAVTSTTVIQFSLYNHPTNGSYSDVPSAYGSLVWKETYDQPAGACSRIVPDEKGYFFLRLGSCNAFPSYLTFSGQLYLGVKIGTDPEATPRVPFAAHPYALNSERLNNLQATTTAQANKLLALDGNQNFNIATGTFMGAGLSIMGSSTLQSLTFTMATGSFLDLTSALAIGGIQLDAVGTNNVTSGAFLVGVFDEFNNSNATTVQAALRDFDMAITSVSSSVYAMTLQKVTDNGNMTTNAIVFAGGTSTEAVHLSGRDTVGVNDARATGLFNLLGGAASEAILKIDADDGSGAGNRAGIIINSDYAGGGDGIIHFSSNGTEDAYIASYPNTLQIVSQNAGGSVSIVTSNTHQYRFEGNGNFGIGNAADLFKLQVSGHAGPSTHDLYDLGSATSSWRNIFAAGYVTTSRLFVNGQEVYGGSVTLDQAYDAGGAGLGRFITTDAGPIQIMNTTGTFGFMSVQHSVDAAGFWINNLGNGDAFSTRNNGSASGFYASNQGNGMGLRVDNSTNDGLGIYIDNNQLGTGFQLENRDNGMGFYLNNTGDGFGARIINAGDGLGLNIQNNSFTGIGFYLRQNAGQGFVLDNNTSGSGVYVANNMNGKGILVDNIGMGDGITIEHSSNRTGMLINNTGVGRGVYVRNDQGTGFEIDNYSDNYYGLNIHNNSTGYGAYIQTIGGSGIYVDDAGSKVGIKINTTAGSANMLDLENRADARPIYILHSGTKEGFWMRNTGTGPSLWIEDNDMDTTPFVLDANGRLGINTGDTGSFNLTSGGHVGPSANNAYDLGAPFLSWQNIYASGTIYGNVVGMINSGFIQGSVIFQGASGLSQDNANFYWDDLANSLMIGTNATSSAIGRKLEINDNVSAGTSLVYMRNGNGGGGGHVLHLRTESGNLDEAMLIDNRGTNAGLKILNGGSGNVYGLLVNSGRVGFGTTTPATQMQVVGTSTMRTILPEIGLVYDLGSSVKRWNNAWVASLHVGTSTWDMSQAENGGLTIGNKSGEQVRISAAGNMGIGDHDPSHKLTVYGGTTAADDLFKISAGISGGYLSIYMDPADDRNSVVEVQRDMAFYSNGWSQTMMYMTNDAVGLGTSQPSRRLSVTGSAIIGQYDSHILPINGQDYDLAINAVDGQLAGTQGNASLTFQRNQMDIGRIKLDTSNRILFQHYDGALWNSNVVIDNNGNMGIGTINPTAKLEISAYNNADNVDLIKFQATNDSDIQSKIYFAHGTNATNWEVNSSGNGGALIMLDNGDEIARFLNSGLIINAGSTASKNFRVVGNSTSHLLFADVSADAVGIGTNAPSNALHVVGTVRATTGFSADNGTAGSPSFYFAGDTNTGLFTPSADVLGITTGGAERMLINGSGNVGIGTTAPNVRLNVVQSGNTVAAFDRLTNDGTFVDFRRDGASVGTISVAAGVVSYNAFSGSHYAWTNESINAGEIVTLTGNNRHQHDAQNSEIIYGIATATSSNDPHILGAYVGLLNPSEPNSNANPHLVNAVGNGDIWVVDKGANIAVGDYLISSDIRGHAMKDTGAYPVSYVFARAAEPLDWSQVTTTVDGVKHAKMSVFFESFARNNSIAAIQPAAIGNVLQSGAVYGPTSTELAVVNTIFRGTVTVLDHMELSRDSVGQAVIMVGATRAHVSFERAYDTLPIVTVTPHGVRRIDYGVENVSLTGFDIVLDPVQYKDVLFDWHAFGERKARVFVSNGTTSDIELTDMGTSKLETQINATAQTEPTPVVDETSPQTTSTQPEVVVTPPEVIASQPDVPVEAITTTGE